MLDPGAHTRRGFADFPRVGFVERGTGITRRDACHRSVTNSRSTSCRALKS